MQTLTLIAFYLVLAFPPTDSPTCDSIEESGKTAVREEPTPSLNTTAAEIYYFHPDHLGSSAWVTDTLGHAVQHLGYLPWGEPYVSQKTGNFSTLYTFSGKERDEETGYSYFGQRFYDSQLSFWLSVDPKRGKYPQFSPFVYCANNPIRIVDPNGETIWIVGEDGTKMEYVENMSTEGMSDFTAQAVNALNQIYETKEGRAMICELIESKNDYNINKSDKSRFVEYDKTRAFAQQIMTDPEHTSSYNEIVKKGVDITGGSGGDVFWNPNGTPLQTTDGILSNSTTDLGHEMFHGLDANRGMLDDRIWLGIKRSESQASYRENMLRKQLGLPIRTHYNGNYIVIGNIPICPTGYK